MELDTLAGRLGIGFGGVAQPARVALTGTLTSPGIDQTIELLGKEKMLARLDAAIAWIEKSNKAH